MTTLERNSASRSPDLQELVSSWKDAEQIVKISEELSHNINLPSALELRYAGKKIIDYLATETEGNATSGQSELLLDALRLIYRAQLDATSAAADSMLKALNNRERTKNETTDEIEHLRQRIENIQNEIHQLARAKNSQDLPTKETRNLTFEIAHALSALKSSGITFSDNEEKREKYWLIPSIIGAVGVATSIFATLWSISS